MSTTRWIIETACPHRGALGSHTHWDGEQVNCPGSSHIVVDPANLPPEAWRVLNAASTFGHPGGSIALWNDITAAFLSDPEQGDQT